MTTDLVVYRPPLPPPPKKSKEEIRAEAIKRKAEKRAAELKELQHTREEQAKLKAIETALQKERLAPYKQAAHTVAAPIKSYGKAAQPYVKSAVQEGWQGAKVAGSAIFHYVFPRSSSSTTKFVLTFKGRQALKTLPPDTIRHYLLTTAYTYGYFTLGGALNNYGDNGIAAAQILAEQGLVERMK